MHFAQTLTDLSNALVQMVTLEMERHVKVHKNVRLEQQLHRYYYTCIDIDECIDVSNDCDEHAICTNVLGSFECSCKNGYTGNGSSCEGKSSDIWSRLTYLGFV